VANSKLRQLNARIRKEKENLYATVLEDTPSLSDVMGNVNSWKNLSYNSQKIQNLKDMADILNFYTEYKTYDMADVALKAEQMHIESLEVTKAVKKIDHRLNTLDKHLAHYDIVKAHGKLVKKFSYLPLDKKNAFYQQYKNKLDEYKVSSDYLAGVQGDYDKLPIAMWEKEREKLITERLEHGERYYKLFKDLSVVEKIRQSTEAFIDEVIPDAERPKPVKSVNKVAKTPAPKPVSNIPTVEKTPKRKPPIKEQLAKARKESSAYNAERENVATRKKDRDFDR